jgi:hypothetical protein
MTEYATFPIVSELKSPQQIAVALRQRLQNEQARHGGTVLPHPNLWDELDPTKVHAGIDGATREQLFHSTREFLKRCPPRARRRHTI